MCWQVEGLCLLCLQQRARIGVFRCGNEFSMPFKSIAVFVDPSPAGEVRTSYAVKMAIHHGAHLIGIFAVPSISSGSPAESFVRGHQAVQQVIAYHRSVEAAAIEAANRSFLAGCAREGISFEFRLLHQGAIDDGAELNSLHADLVIVGERELVDCLAIGQPKNFSSKLECRSSCCQRPGLGPQSTMLWSPGMPAVRRDAR